MKVKTRLFLVLWIAGMTGVLSFLLVDISALIAAFPQPEGTPPPDIPPSLLKILTIAQSIFGIAAGFLYWFRGLEAAIIAHVCAHVVLLAGINMT